MCEVHIFSLKVERGKYLSWLFSQCNLQGENNYNDTLIIISWVTWAQKSLYRDNIQSERAQ